MATNLSSKLEEKCSKTLEHLVSSGIMSGWREFAHVSFAIEVMAAITAIKTYGFELQASILMCRPNMYLEPGRCNFAYRFLPNPEMGQVVEYGHDGEARVVAIVDPVTLAVGLEGESDALVLEYEARSTDEAKWVHPAPIFKPGDVVCFTNDYGVKWHGCRITSVDVPDQWGNRYYLEPTDAPWMYKREANLTYEVLTLEELKAQLEHNGILHRHTERHPEYLGQISAVIEARRASQVMA